MCMMIGNNEIGNFRPVNGRVPNYVSKSIFEASYPVSLPAVLYKLLANK